MIAPHFVDTSSRDSILCGQHLSQDWLPLLVLVGSDEDVLLSLESRRLKLHQWWQVWW